MLHFLYLSDQVKEYFTFVFVEVVFVTTETIATHVFVFLKKTNLLYKDVYNNEIILLQQSLQCIVPQFLISAHICWNPLFMW